MSKEKQAKVPKERLSVRIKRWQKKIAEAYNEGYVRGFEARGKLERGRGTKAATSAGFERGMADRDKVGRIERNVREGAKKIPVVKEETRGRLLPPSKKATRRKSK